MDTAPGAPSSRVLASYAIPAVIDERYLVEGVLADGGQAVVVAAFHMQLRCRVAIKCLLPTATLEQQGMERLRREAQAVASMQSEHVVRFFDLGVLPTGLVYLVMEYLDGADLELALRRHLHEQGGPLPVATAVDYVLQACEGLAVAHARPSPVVHRDLKPANLFLTQRPDGTALVKVLDFGLAKTLHISDESEGDAATWYSSLTLKHAVVGTAQYMSPEQLQGAEDIDARCDIWALGVILYELVAGCLPFDCGNTWGALHRAVLHGAPRDLCAVRPEVPPGLRDVVHRCLERSRSDRYQSLDKLAVALQPFGTPHCRSSVRSVVEIFRRRALAGDTQLPGGRPAPAQEQGPPPILDADAAGAQRAQADAWQASSWTKRQAGELDEAIADATRAIGLFPAEAAYLGTRADHLIARYEQATAAAAGDFGPRPLGSDVAVLDIGRLRDVSAARDGWLRQAIADLTGAMASPVGGNVQLRHHLLRGIAQRLLGGGDALSCAVRDFDVLVASRITSVAAEGFYQRGLARRAQGDLALAAPDLRRAAELGHAEARREVTA
ncbi:MAG: serine/threonine protein kinase [Polyangiaceae bacterium]|nr:serine/threonine protein kinase [Polyangiaceae bacterium]